MYNKAYRLIRRQSVAQLNYSLFLEKKKKKKELEKGLVMDGLAFSSNKEMRLAAKESGAAGQY